MKKSLALISLLAGAVGVHAQGTINVESYVANRFATTIYSENYSNPGASQISGNSPSDTPNGTTTYAAETPLGGTASGAGAGASGEYNGNNYTVGIYIATSLSALTTAVTTGTTAAAGLIYTTTLDTGLGQGNSGTYDASGNAITITDASLAPGATVYVAMAAWYSGSGAGSYSAAKAAGSPSGYVESTGTLALGGGSPPVTAPNFAGIGLTSFDLTATPEPSTIALGVMGASALLFRRRK